MDEAKILLGSLGAALGAYAAFKVSRAIYRNETSTLKDLPGPQSHSLLYGNSKELWASVSPIVFEIAVNVADWQDVAWVVYP